MGSVVLMIKRNSARWLKEKSAKYLKSIYWGTQSVCSDGYFVSKVGRDEKIIRRYIERQRMKDERSSNRLILIA